MQANAHREVRNQGSNRCRGLQLAACFADSKNSKRKGWRAGLELDSFVCLFFTLNNRELINFTLKLEDSGQRRVQQHDLFAFPKKNYS